MPFNKPNKRSTTIKRNIKKRLMEISVNVDNYIYNNKPITQEEAKQYAREISFQRTRCNNDSHILQVIEKLTRYMNIIIKEKDIAPYDQNHPAPEVENTYKDNNTVDNCSLNPVIETETKSNNLEPNTGTFISSISENAQKEDYNTTKTYNGPVNELLVNSYKVNKNENDKGTQHLPFGLNTDVNTSALIITVGRSLGVLATQDKLLNNQNSPLNNTCITNPERFKPDTIYINNNTSGVKEMSNDSRNFCLKNELTKKPKKGIITNIEKTQQMLLLTKVVNTKKKRKPGGGRKPLSNPKKLNATKNEKTNTPHKLKTSSKTTKSRKSLKTNKDLGTNKRQKTSNKMPNAVFDNSLEHTRNLSLVSSCSITNIFSHKHTNKEITNNEVYLPMRPATDKVGPDSVTNQYLLSKQMSALKIDNECARNDFSWIQNIKYVREVTVDEYESMPNGCDDSFWNTSTLPSDWIDLEFLK